MLLFWGLHVRHACIPRHRPKSRKNKYQNGLCLQNIVGKLHSLLTNQVCSGFVPGASNTACPKPMSWIGKQMDSAFELIPRVSFYLLFPRHVQIHSLLRLALSLLTPINVDGWFIWTNTVTLGFQTELAHFICKDNAAPGVQAKLIRSKVDES